MAKVYTILYDANSPELDLNTWYASKGQPILPGYRTNSAALQWMTGANNENVGSMVANPNVDILASKIVLSGDLNWDIENQIVIFARQSLVFDGNGYTITLTKNAVIEFSGLIAAPHQWSYRQWYHSLNDSGGYKGQYTYYRQDVPQWFDYIKDIDENNFDLITIVHVLEHLDKPIENILKLKSILSENGVIYAEVPNLYGLPI